MKYGVFRDPDGALNGVGAGVSWRPNPMQTPYGFVTVQPRRYRVRRTDTWKDAVSLRPFDLAGAPRASANLEDDGERGAAGGAARSRRDAAARDPAEGRGGGERAPAEGRGGGVTRRRGGGAAG